MHYICFVITLALIGLGFSRFPNAVGRLAESCRDLGLSCAGVFCKVFKISAHIDYRINELPNYDYLNLEDIWQQVKTWLSSVLGVEIMPDAPSAPPSTSLPSKWEIFKENWVLYWQAFFNITSLKRYYYYLIWLSWKAFKALMIIVPITVGFIKIFPRLYFREPRRRKRQAHTQETPCQAIRESLPLRIWNFIYFRLLSKIGAFFVDLYEFIKARKDLWRFWLFLVFLYFNVFTILIEMFAYYFYVAATKDFRMIYRQIYKLFLDLKPFFSTIGTACWVALTVLLLNRRSEDTIYERCVRVELTTENETQETEN